MRLLFTPYYCESNPLRKRELDAALANNITNPLIDKIILICDETVPENIKFDFDKVEMCRWGKRCTFADLFYRISPKYSEVDDIKIFANSDIYFDNTLRLVDTIDWSKDVAICLSRWDKTEKGWECYKNVDSQDTWILKGEVKPMYAEFFMGRGGCDNRIMYELDKAGYWVINPAKEIKSYHIHDSNIRTYTAQEAIPPPYKLMMPHDLSNIRRISPPKIFHIGMVSFIAERAIGESLSNTGEYRFINWMDFFQKNDKGEWIDKRRQEFDAICLREAKESDIVFLHVQTLNVITEDLARKIRQINPRVKIVTWDGDKREVLPKYITDIAPYTITMMTNMDDVEEIRKRGFNAEYLQVAFDHNIYRPKGLTDKYAPEIVFMGQNYYIEKEDKWMFPNGEKRYDMVQYLRTEYGDRFGVYGGGWEGIETDNIVHDVVKEASVYRGAKIAINYSHFDSKRYSSDRIFRILGCGTLCLTHNYPEIEKDFIVGEHLDVFNSMDELTEKIEYYLSHPEEAKRIAKKGSEFVHKNCTWRHRIKEMITLLQKYQ